MIPLLLGTIVALVVMLLLAGWVLLDPPAGRGGAHLGRAVAEQRQAQELIALPEPAVDLTAPEPEGESASGQGPAGLVDEPTADLPALYMPAWVGRHHIGAASGATWQAEDTPAGATA